MADGQTLDDVARNPDGTYNGIKAMQWMHKALTGKDMSDEDARDIAARAAKLRVKGRRDDQE